MLIFCCRNKYHCNYWLRTFSPLSYMYIFRPSWIFVFNLQFAPFQILCQKLLNWCRLKDQIYWKLHESSYFYGHYLHKTWLYEKEIAISKTCLHKSPNLNSECISIIKDVKCILSPSEYYMYPHTLYLKPQVV